MSLQARQRLAGRDAPTGLDLPADAPASGTGVEQLAARQVDGSLGDTRALGRGTRAQLAGSRRAASLPGVGIALAAIIPLAFLAIFFAWPVAHMLGLGFTDTSGAVDLGGFAEVFTRPRTWRIIGLTLGQAFAATLIAVVLGVPGAWVLYCRRFPGAALARAFVSLPFVMPAVVVGVAFRQLLGPGGPLGSLGLDGSFAAIVAALVFFNYSVVVRQVGTLWSQLDPRTAQAARTLGASAPRVFFTVTLPALAPALASAASLVFLFCATSFAVVLILGGISYGTIETEIYLQTTQFLNLRAAAVLSLTQLVVVAACLWASGRARTRRRAATLTAPHQRPAPLTRSDAAPTAVTALTLALLAAPLAALVAGSLRTASGISLGNYAALGTLHGQNVTAWQALGSSLQIALVAAAVSVVLGLAIAVVLSRPVPRPPTPPSPARKTLSAHEPSTGAREDGVPQGHLGIRSAWKALSARGVGGRRGGTPGLWRWQVRRAALRALDAAFMVPLGVSAVTVGFGFLVTLDRPPVDLRASWLLIPLAQAVVAIPLVVRTVLPTLQAIDPRQREAAATLGAPPWRVFLTVDAPVALRAAGLATGFALAVALGEFGATSFLARPDAPTLPVLIYRLLGRPGVDNLGLALAASVVLAAVTVAVMGVAERARVAGAGDV